MIAVFRIVEVELWRGAAHFCFHVFKLKNRLLRRHSRRSRSIRLVHLDRNQCGVPLAIIIGSSARVSRYKHTFTAFSAP